ncbi:MAG TPA: hypothetical protein VF681_03235 [Abditibacteriaceae bacterium]|jgi:ribosomal protein L7/L12
MLSLIAGFVAFGCVGAALVQHDSRLLVAALIALGISIASTAFGLWLRALNGDVAHLPSSSTVFPVSAAPDGSDEDVRALARSGRKIDAIKLYRTRHRVGLKEAKEAVERM